MHCRFSLPIAMAAFVFGGAAISSDIAAAAGGTASSDTYTLVTEPDQGLAPIYNLIGTAKKTIDMTMYEFTDTHCEQLLAQAAAAGVTVRVILDQNLEKGPNQPAYTYLSQNGVQLHWANPAYAATHQKTITVDGSTSAIMSLNLTSQYYSTSRDFAVIENDPNDVSAIEQTFNADFRNSKITPPDGDRLVWSPTNSQGALLGLIDAAQHSLSVENEEMSDAHVVNALVSAASRGVLVQIAMTNDGNEYASEFGRIVAAGGEISTYAETASLYIHAKVVLADYGSPDAQLFIGSQNFSNASLTENRELGLIVSDAAIMTSMAGILISDFAGGTPWSGSRGNFSIEASPDSLTVKVGSSGTVSVTTHGFDNFKSTVSLAVSGLPSGVAARFTPPSIATPGTGSSTLTLSVSGAVAAGTYDFTIAGSGGGVDSTVGVSLTIASSGVPKVSLSANPGARTR
jgi:cardiolipin synthase